MGQSLSYIMNNNYLVRGIAFVGRYIMQILWNDDILCIYITHYVDTHIRMKPIAFMHYVCRGGLMYLGPKAKTKIETFYIEYLNTI